jgi:CO dehydrogenase/acetyl-CoA synthase epsilon subunit
MGPGAADGPSTTSGTKERERSVAIVQALRSKVNGAEATYAMTSELAKYLKDRGVGISGKELHDFLVVLGVWLGRNFRYRVVISD